jgi:AraC-like DNA-binding protein
VKFGWQTIEGAGLQIRHSHTVPYAAVVMAGRYEEAGERGRWRVSVGEVLVHGAFDAHCNRFETRRVDVLNIPLCLGSAPAFAAGRCEGLSELARLAGRADAQTAAHLLLKTMKPHCTALDDWPDRLAADLRRNPRLNLSHWAERHGMRRETVSRGFAKLYGVTPVRFRAEARARQAWRMALGSQRSLAEIACAAGFSDQCHMTRAVVALTGRAPGQWRRSNPFKTAAA